jgi:hypothetical protein
MRELETSLQQFGEFLLKARLVRENAAHHCVHWVRRFLARPASNEPLADQALRFAEELERSGRLQDWQVRQAEQAVRIYFVNFLQRTDWRRSPAIGPAQEQRRTDPWLSSTNSAGASARVTTPIGPSAATPIG